MSTTVMRVLLLLAASCGGLLHAQPTTKPIRALLVTGGCCHDYARQKVILARGISARAPVEWTIAHQGGTATHSKIPLYEDPDWAKGFDVVVHNECFSDAKDVEWVERILKPHREGVPAVLIHCAMHSYRTGGDHWFEFVGLQSPGHGPHYPFTVENLAAEHPIMKGFGERWTTPKGELYHSIKTWPKMTPLAHAQRMEDGQPQICVWTNEYGKAKVFATTIGHYNEEMAEPEFLDLVTRGLLWSVGRLDETTFRKTDEKTDAEIRALVTMKLSQLPSQGGTVTPVAGNLAHGKPVTCSSQQGENAAAHGNDGRDDTRWCASGPGVNETWQVDLEQPQRVQAVRIRWEGDAAYRHRIEASADAKTWTTVVDASEAKDRQHLSAHRFDAPATRYLRVTFLGSDAGGWGSFWEFEAFANPLPPGAAERNEPQVRDVRAPEGFDVSLFGTPPEVNYPVCLAAAAAGELFVGVDEQGSLGKEKGRGKVLRCIDRDGDGRADDIRTFATVDHPRGLIYDAGSLWVLHPPSLTVFHDENGDGVADREQRLLEGVSTDQVAARGADHTTNGIRLGIDGWIYIAVGDFGFNELKGADGRVLRRRGGGVVRVRPDGTDAEIFAWGLRNIVDVAVDPRMNIFTRDNTNDGGGWNVRFSEIFSSADYGYPSKYIHYPGEMMPPLADYGGGSGCGAMALYDQRWPETYRDAILTCDWGRSEIFLHRPEPVGPTHRDRQSVFLSLPRPTDVDLDGRGVLYAASWKNGQFAYQGPDVGFVAQVWPKNFVPRPVLDVARAGLEELLAEWRGPSHVMHLAVQRELLRRGRSLVSADVLVRAATEQETPVVGRIAALWTLKQLYANEATPALLELAHHDELRSSALRALADRRAELDGVPVEVFVQALTDVVPAVRVQAIVGLGRLGRADIAPALLPLTQRTEGSVMAQGRNAHAEPDPERVIPHLAVQALVALAADDVCLAALRGPQAAGARAVLSRRHTEPVVAGLVQEVNAATTMETLAPSLAALARLYYREGEYTRSDWWGTRPDTHGPYYDRQEWLGTAAVKAALLAVNSRPNTGAGLLLRERMKAERISLPEVSPDGPDATAEAAMLVNAPKFDPSDPQQIGNLPVDAVVSQVAEMTGDAERGRALFVQQSCVACHSFVDGQTPKGPHLVDIGKRSPPRELAESILKPSSRIAQGFDTYSFVMESGLVVSGFVALESAETVQVRQSNGAVRELVKEQIEERVKLEASSMPTGMVDNLRLDQVADLLAYLRTLKSSASQ